MKQKDFDSIKKCACVNILKEPKISCTVNTPVSVLGSDLINAPSTFAGTNDTKKEISKLLDNFNMDKLFSFKMYESFSTEAHLSLVPPDSTDTLSWIKKIKSSPTEETVYNYPFQKGNVYTPFLKEKFDCVLETIINSYELERTVRYEIDKIKVTPNIKIKLKVTARLVRIKDSKILWTTNVYTILDNSCEYDKLIADGGVELRKKLVETADISVNKLLEKFLVK
ncbi:MAG: hypothetical protein PHX21_07355 [bacterium]|nr:hypothetical protein [bacterium]